MAEQIRVTPQKLRQTAGQFQTAGEEIKGLTSAMTGTVQSLSGRIWSGEAARTYTGHFQGLQDDILSLLRQISEHASVLTQVAGQYEAAEEANRTEAAALLKDIQ